MKIFKNRKKSGFTLMEVAIAVMIVGVLTALCIPIVQRQLEKSDEYAYYMAYRSVEKLGGQIVALGDPEDSLYNSQNISNDIKLALDKKSPLQIVKDKIVLTFSTLGTRFTYTEKYLFKNLFPKSFAVDEQWDNYGNISDGNYYFANISYRVCKGGEAIKNPENCTVDTSGNEVCQNYTCADLVGSDTSVFDNYGLVAGLLPENGCFFNDTEASKNSKLAQLETFLKNDKSENGNLAGFCAKLNTTGYCAGVDSEGTSYKTASQTQTMNYEAGYDEDGNYEEAETVEETTCNFYKLNSQSGGSSGSASSANFQQPKVTDTCTPANGYYGMYNAGGDYNLSCECKNNKYATQNNDKVCCPYMSGANTYAKSNITTSMSEGPLQLNNYTGYCVHCLGDFNSVGNWCCPEHSVFNGTECQCVEGYDMLVNKGTASEQCKHTECAKGSHLDEETEVCVPNPPLVKADIFCKLIDKNWNTTSHSCNTFSKVDNVNVYQAVLDAAKGEGGGAYLSIRSKKGAFGSSLTPNIVLSNGLKLWILGDKAASIPGLSYNPVGITSTQNMCREILSGSGEPLSTKTKCEGKGFFCKGEGHCYNLDAQSLTKMGDARNCCASTDISDIAYDVDADKDNRAFAVSGFTVFVDINGDKGSGTLWEDVFPFFVGANGKVYPGYPLDAPKEVDSTSNGLYLGGNSVKNLPVDVFYYENDTRSDNARKKVIVWSNVSFARGVCYSRILNAHTPYCQNLGLKARGSGNNKTKIKDAILNSSNNECNNHNCFINVRNKLRFF